MRDNKVTAQCNDESGLFKEGRIYRSPVPYTMVWGTLMRTSLVRFSTWPYPVKIGRRTDRTIHYNRCLFSCALWDQFDQYEEHT